MSVIEVFDKGGFPLGEFVADASREWILNGHDGRNSFARCEFSAALIDPKIQTSWFEFGNYVMIRDAKLPWWGGIIIPPRTWDKGNVIEVTAISAEYQLYRRRANEGGNVDGTPGDYFETILAKANQQGDTLIRPGSVAKRGGAAHRHYDFSHISDAINEFAAEFKQDWWIEPAVIDGRLVFLGNWAERRGLVFDFVLDEQNSQLMSVGEEGEIANDLEGVSTGDTASSKLRQRARDETSIGRYGLFQARETMSAKTDEELLKLVQEKLKQTAYPKRVFEVAALPADGKNLAASCAWPYLAPGNTLTLQYKRAGLDNGTLGILTQGRITSMTHRETENVIDLVFEEVR